MDLKVQRVEFHKGRTPKSKKKFDLSTINNSNALRRNKYLQQVIESSTAYIENKN
jgi:hypothetical protein